MDQANRARTLDPVTPILVAGSGVVHGPYDEAVAAFEEELEIDPQNLVVNLWPTVAWLGKRNYGRAMAAIEHARPFQLMATETEGVIQSRAANVPKRKPSFNNCTTKLIGGVG